MNGKLEQHTLKPENFVYWLQGFVEIGDGKPPTEKEWNTIKEHLELCFDKVIPNSLGLLNNKEFPPLISGTLIC